MKKSFIILIYICFIALFFSCDSSDKKKINKTGNEVGESVGELVHGISSGVHKAYSVNMQLSDSLTGAGLSTGKVTINDSSGKNNLLDIYFIFNKNFHHDITIKVFDSKGLEMGRCRKLVKGKAGDAHFFDFLFDPKTDLSSDCKFIAE